MAKKVSNQPSLSRRQLYVNNFPVIKVLKVSSIAYIIPALNELPDFLISKVDKSNNAVDYHQHMERIKPIPKTSIAFLTDSIIRESINNQQQYLQNNKACILYQLECQVNLVPKDLEVNNVNHLQQSKRQQKSRPYDTLIDKYSDKKRVEEIPSESDTDVKVVLFLVGN